MAKKNETVDAEGVDLSSPVDDPASTLEPEVGIVGDHNAPDGSSARTGEFARVTGGEHEGRYGVVQQADKVGKDGLPKTVAVRTRDDNDEIIVVDYSDLERALPGGR